MSTRARISALVLSVVALVLAGTSAASAAPPYAKVPGSPFGGLIEPAWAVAFNSQGTLLATTDNFQSLELFGVDLATGAVTPIARAGQGSGSGPTSVAFGSTSTETFLAVANQHTNAIRLYSVSAAGALTRISDTTLTNPTAVAFNSAGTVLGATTGASVATYSVSPTGLTLVSNLTLAGNPGSLAFSPNGSELAVGQVNLARVATYSVAGDGSLTLLSDTNVTGTRPASVAFSPNGQLLAVANATSNSISMFSVNTSTGALTAIGTPQPTGHEPVGVAFNATGQLLATSNYADPDVSIFSVNEQTGALAQVSGSPFTTGSGSHPDAVAFSRTGLLAVPDWVTGGISMFAPAAPTAQIASPVASGFVYGVGQSVPASFSCADSIYGMGIASCTDSNGSHAPGGHLTTAAPGQHTYAVTATSADGQSSQTTLIYTVAALPTATISSPTPNRTYRLGSKVKSEFSCEEGAFGPGLLSCSDSSGDIAPRGLLATASFGSHRYTVTVISDDGLLATAQLGYRVAAPPSAAITVPAAGAHYSLGKTVDARYSCSEGLGGPGIASCKGPVRRRKKINTTAAGRHTFKVTARSKDGFEGSRRITYFVS